MQSFGKIVQCAPAVGAKMWCLYVFVCNFLSRSEAGALFVRGGIVRTSIALPFIGRFLRGFQPFSEGIDLSGALHGSHFCR